MDDNIMQNALVFVGAAGAGKDTAAAAVLEAIPGSRNLKFASALKDATARIYGWNREKLDTDLTYKESQALYFDGTPQVVRGGETLTRRQILQHVGTDVFRQLNDDVWLYAALHDVVTAEMADGPSPLWVVTDARFLNEVEFLREKFQRVRVVRIHREGATEGTAASAHVSERQGNQIKVDQELFIRDGEIKLLQLGAVDTALRFIGWRSV